LNVAIMPDPDDLEAIEEALIEAASAPASVTAGGTSVTERSADDLIKLDQYVAQKAAIANASPGFGLRTARAKPPGAAPT
jgi:hypothetical protein